MSIHQCNGLYMTENKETHNSSILNISLRIYFCQVVYIRRFYGELLIR